MHCVSNHWCCINNLEVSGHFISFRHAGPQAGPPPDVHPCPSCVRPRPVSFLGRTRLGMREAAAGHDVLRHVYGEFNVEAPEFAKRRRDELRVLLRPPWPPYVRFERKLGSERQWSWLGACRCAGFRAGANVAHDGDSVVGVAAGLFVDRSRSCKRWLAQVDSLQGLRTWELGGRSRSTLR